MFSIPKFYFELLGLSSILLPQIANVGGWGGAAGATANSDPAVGALYVDSMNSAANGATFSDWKLGRRGRNFAAPAVRYPLEQNSTGGKQKSHQEKKLLRFGMASSKMKQLLSVHSIALTVEQTTQLMLDPIFQAMIRPGNTKVTAGPSGLMVH